MDECLRIGVVGWRGLSLCLGALAVLACGGCALIPLATLGTLLGMAGTAASTAPEVYQAGKLETALMVDDDHCRRAVRLAAEDLQLRLARECKESGHRQIWEFELLDDRKSDIEVTVERRSAMLCWCQVDVGVFGSEPTAKLVLRCIESHLPSAATEPSAQTK